MPTANRLAVALLAAGRSQRFGVEDKLNIALGGKPLLHWGADVARMIDAAQHFIVTGPDFPQHNLPAGYRRLINYLPDQGLASSLRMVARHAREADASALLVLLGDMPFVTINHLHALLAGDPAHSRAVFSRAPGGPPQPPALLPAALFTAMESLGGDSGARTLGSDALFVEASAEMLIDVDTLADLERCTALLGH